MATLTEFHRQQSQILSPVVAAVHGWTAGGGATACVADNILHDLH
jgi:enoyl-CoA hydratase/carnithine racemase